MGSSPLPHARTTLRLAAGLIPDGYARQLVLISDGQENLEPAYSPDGRLIAYHSKEGGGIWLIPALGGAPRQVTETGTRPTFTPDGTEIFYQSGPATDLSPASYGPMPPSVVMSVPVAGGRPRARTRAGQPAGGADPEVPLLVGGDLSHAYIG